MHTNTCARAQACGTLGFGTWNYLYTFSGDTSNKFCIFSVAYCQLKCSCTVSWFRSFNVVPAAFVWRLFNAAVPPHLTQRINQIQARYASSLHSLWLSAILWYANWPHFACKTVTGDKRHLSATGKNNWLVGSNENAWKWFLRRYIKKTIFLGKQDLEFESASNVDGDFPTFWKEGSSVIYSKCATSSPTSRSGSTTMIITRLFKGSETVQFKGFILCIIHCINLQCFPAMKSLWPVSELPRNGKSKRHFFFLLHCALSMKKERVL